MMAAKFYAHLVLEDENMDLLFCHRWLLLGFKREFYDLHALRMWEACWSHYQTEFFHIFICVAIVVEYGDPVWQKSMRVDEMLNYFNNLAMEMDGDRVLKQARSLLYQFRKLAGIPCTLRGLLSGPGAWDSATLPEIECTCHETNTCKYLNLASQGKRLSKENSEMSEKQDSDQEGSEYKEGRETHNKHSGDGIEPQEESEECEFHSAEENEKQQNGCSEEELESSESQEQEKGINEAENVDHEEQHKESLKTELSNTEAHDTCDVNHKSCDDLSSKEQSTNEKMIVGDDQREDNENLSGDFSSEIQQNMPKECTNVADEIPKEEQDESNLKDDKESELNVIEAEQVNDET